MFDLKIQCPELLHQLPGFPNEGTGTALEDIISSIKKNQRSIKTKLGFTDEEDTLEQSVQVNLLSSLPVTFKLIEALIPPEERETADIFDNKLKSGMKITRAVQRRVASGAHVLDLLSVLTAERVIEQDILRKELPKLPISNGLDILLNPMVLVQNFYSEVASLRGKSVGITFNPLMFIRGTNASTYRSCYTISQHYNSAAPITLGLSGYAAMIYNRSADAILGRCWVIFNPQYTSFFVLKSYGFLANETIDTVCGWLCTLLNPEASWLVKHNPHADMHVSISDQGVYGDPITRVYSCDNNNGSITNFMPLISIPPSRCILCGKIHASSRIICDHCWDRYISRCNRCGHFMFRDAEHKIQLCPSCLKTKKICPDCGSIYDADKECKCKIKVPVCTFCGKPSIVSLHGISLCEECAKVIHTEDTCHACGGKGLMYPYKGKPVCQTCFTYLMRKDYSLPHLPYEDKLQSLRGA